MVSPNSLVINIDLGWQLFGHSLAITPPMMTCSVSWWTRACLQQRLQNEFCWLLGDCCTSNCCSL